LFAPGFTKNVLQVAIFVDEGAVEYEREVGSVGEGAVFRENGAQLTFNTNSKSPLSFAQYSIPPAKVSLI